MTPLLNNRLDQLENRRLHYRILGMKANKEVIIMEWSNFKHEISVSEYTSQKMHNPFEISSPLKILLRHTTSGLK